MSVNTFNLYDLFERNANVFPERESLAFQDKPTTFKALWWKINNLAGTLRAKDIKKGDGVIIRKGINSATYLPQVWDDLPRREVFFSTLCQKAGLEADCYKESDMDFYCYQAEVFSE